jgi:hypothetical protein
MTSTMRIWVAIVAVAIIALLGWSLPKGGTVETIVRESLGGTTNYDALDVTDGYSVDTAEVIGATGAITQGGTNCTITDANGGTYTLTDAEMSACGQFTVAAGGAGQAAIALTMPATSTMALTIPNAGQCRKWYYDSSALAAGTTTTMTAGTGHNIIAYTTNDDVIDGGEFSEITMCRASDTDVNTYVTEMLNAD